MEKFEFKSAVCTSVEQSKRLLELGLKKETADMCWLDHALTEDYDDWRSSPIYKDWEDWQKDGIPAWSLHRLLEMLYADIGECMIFFPNTYDEFIADIENHIRRGCFNQDYLEER